MRSDERGQMMLLAAIVLLIAFVSMAVMISRVTLVASETSRDQHGPFLREAAAVSATLELMNSTTTTDQLFGIQVADLQEFEARRGYLLSWSCNESGLDAFQLTDGRSKTLIYVTGAEGATGCD